MSPTPVMSRGMLCSRISMRSATTRTSGCSGRTAYMKGGIGDVKCKKFLEKVLNKELDPIRARRIEAEKDIPAIYDMLKAGCEKARETAGETLSRVRKAMKIDYFSDKELIDSQSARYAGAK